MTRPPFSTDAQQQLFELAVALNRVDSIEAAINRYFETIAAVFDHSVAAVYAYDPDTAETTVIAATQPSAQVDTTHALPPADVLSTVHESGTTLWRDDTPDTETATDLRDPLQSEILTPIDGLGVLSVGSTESNRFDETEKDMLDGIAETLGAAVDRLDQSDANPAAETPSAVNEDQPAFRRMRAAADNDATALRRLHELTLDVDDFDATVDRLLSLGCDHFDLQVGILSQIDGTAYHLKSVIDPTGSYEQGAVFDLSQTMCETTLENGAAEPLAFADVTNTDHATHPAADNVGAYIAAPVIVDGDTYGTVNFSSRKPRADAIRPSEREFVKLVAQWIGTQIEQSQRLTELERYETIMEAVDDPVYALDTEGRFTFVNEAAKRVFGYGQEVIDEHVSIGMDAEDIKRIRKQRKALAETGERSVTAQFELETVDGGKKIAETRLAVIGDGEFRGTAGMIRDVTEREQRRRQLESFQQAIEEAADGVAILVGEEYIYADQTHVEMYGFDSDDQLLGDTWRKLYDDEEVARLEAEAFSALESEGHWRGKVTGSRPDGTTFPAELSLTIIDDGRLVCTVRDETERTARKRELELKERAMDETDVSIQITDPTQDNNPLIYVNSGFERVTGYSRRKALGRNPRFLQGPETDPAKTMRLREAISDGRPVTMELKNYRGDGTPYWARLSVTPVYEDETLVNYIGIQQDVTEEKLREQRLRALHGTTRELLGADSIHDAATVAVETLCEELEVDVAGIYRRENDELVRVVSEGPEPVSVPERVGRGQTPLWDAMESGTSVVYEDVGDIDDDIDRAEITASAYFSLDGHGVAAVGTQDPDGLDDSTRQLIEVLAGNLVAVFDTIQRQNELTQQRERFRLLTESVDEYAFLTVDEDGTISTWNDGAERLFGYDTEAALGQSVGLLHPASDRGSGLINRLLQQARIAGESAHEGWRVRADGSEFYADVRYALLETDDGEFQGYAKVIRDMTERRRQQRRTELFVEESDDVVSVLDTDGTITYVSGSAARVLGYDPTDLVGENLFDYLHPNSRERAIKQFFNATTDGTESVQTECRLKSGDGDWLNVEGRCRNMLDNSAIDGMLLYLRNVTERKDRSRRLNAIFNGTFQFTGLLEPNGTVIEANEAALAFGGFERESVVGEKFYDVPWWTHSEAVNHRVRDAIQSAAAGEFIRYETDVEGIDRIGTIDFSVKPVFDEDEKVTLLIVEGRNITAQRRQRQHLEVMQRVMRHNMRNDLTKLRGWTEVITEETDAEQRTQQFGRIERILDKWEKMGKELRQIEKAIESQQGQVTSTDVTTLLQEVVDRTTAEYPDATVDLTGVDREPVEMSPVIGKALQELVDNAIRSTDNQPSRIELRLSRPTDNWIEIGVVDNGPGMPEMEAKVLETGEETPLNHGQGLGVWMIRMLVKEAGGDVSVDVTDEGTSVNLRLPIGHTGSNSSTVAGEY